MGGDVIAIVVVIVLVILIYSIKLFSSSSKYGNAKVHP
jgi:hypothetical protein